MTYARPSRNAPRNSSAEGLDDYHSAKIKAAKQLGQHDKKSLPDNHEIEAALREYHALFSSDTQPHALRQLRIAAVRAMQWLSDFSPWLTGSVLTGTANEYSAIELELIGADAKMFEMFLLNEDVIFDIHEHHVTKSRERSFKPNQRPHDGGYTYEITFDDAPVEITVFDTHTDRLAKYPKASIKHERVQINDAIAKFGAATDVS